MMQDKLFKDAHSDFVQKSLRGAKSFVFKSKKSYEQEDNTPWLITFADLMAILLVFCLILLKMYSKTAYFSDTCQHRQTSESFNTLVSIAEAKGDRSFYDFSIPLRMYHKNYIKQPSGNETEKIIAKITIPLLSVQYVLEERHKVGLQRIASLLMNNPSAKVIISMPCREPSSHQMNFINEIISYLTSSCNIDGKSIYFKSMIPIPKAQESSAEDIEVSIMKDFWTL